MKTADRISLVDLLTLANSLLIDGKEKIGIYIIFQTAFGFKFEEMRKIRKVYLFTLEFSDDVRSETNVPSIINSLVLKNYIDCSGKFLSKLEDYDLVFNFSRAYINTELRRIKNNYHIKCETLSTHTFRKIWAYHLFKANGSTKKYLNYLSKLLGHDHSRVTKEYLSIKEGEIV